MKYENYLTIIMLFFSISFISMNADNNNNTNNIKKTIETDSTTFGAGCFWCVEVIFEKLDGVISVESGYSGGHIVNPTYKDVMNGTTNHTEVTRIVFNPNIISFSELLEVFWKIHDPTTLNRQGNDIGSQYRSVIFYHNEKQKEEAEYYKKQLEKEEVFDMPIVTKVTPLINYFKAEDYHQDFYKLNPENSYCNYIITPKIEKFKKIFKSKLKN